MNGFENTAGSAPIVRAANGMRPPTVAAKAHTVNSVAPITRPTGHENTSPASRSPSRPRHPPRAMPTRSSRTITRGASRGRTSSRASARVTVVAAWLPVLPPVPMISGMNRERTTISSSVSSKTPSTCTVRVAPTASTSSHVMRERISASTEVAR